MKRLSARQTKTLAVLLEADNAPQAAEIANVPLTTLRRWLRDAGFRAELDRLRGDVLARTVERLAGLGAAAVSTLERNLQAESAMVQVASAKTVLAFAFKGHEALQVERKLAEIEALLQGKEPPCRLRAV